MSRGKGEWGTIPFGGPGKTSRAMRFENGEVVRVNKNDTAYPVSESRARQFTPTETIRAIAEAHNLDPADINSEIYEDRPLIAEEELSVTVLDFCRAGRHDLAAKEIEIAVRRAYGMEAAA